MTEQQADPDLPRAASRLSLLFAGQLVAMLLFVAGGILLLVTVAHNNSSDCSSIVSAAPCRHRSYALPIGLLAGGFVLFLVNMVLSVSFAARTGASVLSAVMKRRG